MRRETRRQRRCTCRRRRTTTVQILPRRARRWKQINRVLARQTPSPIPSCCLPRVHLFSSLTDAGGFVVVAGADRLGGAGKAQGRGVGCEEEGRSSGGSCFWWPHQPGEKGK